MTENLPVKHENKGVDAYRTSTDAASVCKEIVVASALTIQGRKYVRVEGWQAIAIAHGCVASSGDVHKVEGGFTAMGYVRRMSDGVIISQAEGFVGNDEKDNRGNMTWGSRPEYAQRAMAQTRAISRACRSAFAHVVVMMNAGLSTTPAEEVPAEGFPTDPEPAKPQAAAPRPPANEPAAQKPAEGQMGLKATGFVTDVVTNPQPTKTGGYRTKIVLDGKENFYTFNTKIVNYVKKHASDDALTITYHVGKFGNDIDAVSFPNVEFTAFCEDPANQ